MIMRVIKILFMGKNLKYGIGALVGLATLVGGSILYVNHLRSTVQDLEVSYREVIASNKSKDETIARQERLFSSELKAVNTLFDKYIQLSEQDRSRVRDLENYFSGIDDEKLQECLNTRVSDEFVDQLFPVQ